MAAGIGLNIGEPQALAVLQTESHDSAAIETEICIALIGGATEIDLALWRGRFGSDRGFPYNSAFVLRIVCPDNAALLRGDEDGLAAG